MQLPLWHQHRAVQIAVEAASLRVLGTGRVSRGPGLPGFMKHPQSKRALSMCVYVGPTWLLELVLGSNLVEVKNLVPRAPLKWQPGPKAMPGASILQGTVGERKRRRQGKLHTPRLCVTPTQVAPCSWGALGTLGTAPKFLAASNIPLFQKLSSLAEKSWH